MKQFLSVLTSPNDVVALTIQQPLMQILLVKKINIITREMIQGSKLSKRIFLELVALIALFIMNSFQMTVSIRNGIEIIMEDLPSEAKAPLNNLQRVVTCA